ncbi:ATP-dependent DNA helicase pif1-like [Leptopilina heterotoma]|uniref:ATP-dependent DNA helicase pif1-like n=1 Tax=Leptopilina heterotoma TaxID=63436 RepID=UPI001CA9718B|nr:ATP-dependent DNA helicase pif1-like [Leptopilina heterotoma]
MRETITGEDGYPTYRRRSPEQGGFTAELRVRREIITVDNRWIVPYSPVLLRTFETHINVEFCGSMKSIKYVCKYVNKGSDQASFHVANGNDEISMYQTGRYISTSEAFWRIFEFQIHERYPPVIQLDVHLENGQRVYFRPENVQDRVENPSNTTLMAFFKLCQSDNFAKLLLYCEVPSYYTFNKQKGQFSRRKRGKPVQGHPAVASSGIAATLLPGGRTAHSMFKIPINIDQMEIPLCSITKNCNMAKVLRECVLIVWDECTMANKRGIEALDRTLQDVRNCNLTMGGVNLLFSGDFRQILPVVVRGTRADEVNSCIKKSFLWPKIIRFSLLQNMRVHLGGEQGAQEFSNLLIAIGNGTLEEIDGSITIPTSLATVVTSQEELIEHVFPGIENLLTIQSSWLCERAILTPTKEQAKQLNQKILSLFEAEERTYFSVNSCINDDDSVHYPIEFLDSVTAPGLPAHEIKVKVGAPIMLLRNINPPKLCNGTRLRVRTLHRFIIEADILAGCAAEESVFIPRIPLIPSNYPFQFKRLQFPISLCFAMTVNKSQGKTLSTVGLDLEESGCFSHGQFYVGCSRMHDWLPPRGAFWKQYHLNKA